MQGIQRSRVISRGRAGHSGFTLIELLVVIAIIGVLASVVLAALSSARERAQYTGVAADLKSAATAFNMLYNEQGCWPVEGSTACNGISIAVNTVSALIDDPNFGLGKFLPRAPRWPFSTQQWHYDNDGDAVVPGCTSVSSRGVNLFLSASPEQYRKLNDVLDGDADPDTIEARACGMIKFTGTTDTGTLFFVLSATQ